MFGFSLATQLFQGSAQRTWNCVTHFTNLLWYKFNHIRHPIMPRSRRRHHSRSRSRSRSHSHDKDRDAKRRKLDNVDSPLQKRSVSCEPPSPATSENNEIEVPGKLENLETTDQSKVSDKNQMETAEDTGENPENVQATTVSEEKEEPTNKISEESLNESKTNDEPKENPIKYLEAKLMLTPKKALSPKQLQKKHESEKKRQQKQVEREEREKVKQQEKDRIRLEKEKQKQEKDEQKAKERELKEEQKRKEKEEKEAKRKEKEEREETKRKEREQEKLKKQQELEEKNREKQKMEEQKQKTSQAFVSFFKKTEAKVEENKSEVKLFMPFEVKSDMRLAPSKRANLSEEAAKVLDEFLNGKNGERLYLKELKGGKKAGKGSRTWAYEEDVMIVEEDFGESICEDKQKTKKMRAKFLKFHENKRPAYYGTWRKKSSTIKSRRPCVEDKNFFDYEVDSDDDWEEEEQGESLNGSDDEDKENEADNEDYEVDNDFFVPHGHLSDDEVDDEATSKLSPESHKQKLKLLKDEFDQDMQAKTNKMKPRSIGCIWYNKDGSNVEEAIDRHLKPLAMLIAGQVFLKKRKNLIAGTPTRKCNTNELSEELIPAFLKLVHGNTNKKRIVVQEFITYMQKNGHVVEVTKRHIGQRLNQLAQWKKCEEGPKRNSFCWWVEDDTKKKYNVV